VQGPKSILQIYCPDRPSARLGGAFWTRPPAESMLLHEGATRQNKLQRRHFSRIVESTCRSQNCLMIEYHAAVSTLMEKLMEKLDLYYGLIYLAFAWTLTI
jgi:hypothetical protein